SQQNRACHCHRSDRPLSYLLYQLERVSQGAARLRIGTGPRVALIGDEVDHLPLGGVHRRVKAARSRRPGVSCSRSRWTPRRRSRARAGLADLRISATRSGLRYSDRNLLRLATQGFCESTNSTRMRLLALASLEITDRSSSDAG